MGTCKMDFEDFAIDDLGGGGDEGIDSPFSDAGMMEMGGLDAENLDPFAQIHSIASDQLKQPLSSSHFSGSGFGGSDFGMPMSQPGGTVQQMNFVDGGGSSMILDRNSTLGGIICFIILLLILLAIVIIYIISLVRLYEIYDN